MLFPIFRLTNQNGCFESRAGDRPYPSSTGKCGYPCFPEDCNRAKYLCVRCIFFAVCQDVFVTLQLLTLDKRMEQVATKLGIQVLDIGVTPWKSLRILKPGKISQNFCQWRRKKRLKFAAKTVASLYWNPSQASPGPHLMCQGLKQPQQQRMFSMQSDSRVSTNKLLLNEQGKLSRACAEWGSGGSQKQGQAPPLFV